MITIRTTPISVNKLYKGRKFLTDEGEATKLAMGWEAKIQWKKEPLTGNVEVKITFHFKDNRSDIDNCLKALLDSLKGICWLDDKQIVDLYIHKRIDRVDPRIEIYVGIPNLLANPMN